MTEKTLEEFADLLGRLLAQRHMQEASTPVKERDRPTDVRRDGAKPSGAAECGSFESCSPTDPAADGLGPEMETLP